MNSSEIPYLSLHIYFYPTDRHCDRVVADFEPLVIAGTLSWNCVSHRTFVRVRPTGGRCKKVTNPSQCSVIIILVDDRADETTQTWTLSNQPAYFGRCLAMISLMMIGRFPNYNYYKVLSARKLPTIIHFVWSGHHVTVNRRSNQQFVFHWLLLSAYALK